MGRRAWCIAVLAVACSLAQAAPYDFLPPLPPTWSWTPALPAIEPESIEQTAQLPARALRNRAIKAFESGDMKEAIRLLDDLANIATLPPSLRLLRAWMASHSSRDAVASEGWSALAEAGIEAPRAHYYAGWHLCRLGLNAAALEHAQWLLREQPVNREALHLAALAYWGLGQHAQAGRFMIRAMRMHDPLQESFLAMAAINIERGHFAEGTGWIRRVAPHLKPEQLALWLSGPSFERAWREEPAYWIELLSDLGIPADLGYARSFASNGERDPEIPAASTIGSFGLQLSPFAIDQNQRAQQVLQRQINNRLHRLQVDEQLEPGEVIDLQD